MLVVLTFGTLLVIYLVTCSSLFLATRLIFPEHSLQKSDWLFGLFGFLLVPASWGFWWTYAGRGVYGWLNMMHVTWHHRWLVCGSSHLVVGASAFPETYQLSLHCLWNLCRLIFALGGLRLVTFDLRQAWKMDGGAVGVGRQERLPDRTGRNLENIDDTNYSGHCRVR